MKAISLLLATMGILILTLFLPGRALAELNWYVCSIEQAGPAGTATTIYIRLSDTADPPEFLDTWFRALVGREKEYLAVALTAMSLNRNVSPNSDTRFSIKLKLQSIPKLGSSPSLFPSR